MLPSQSQTVVLFRYLKTGKRTSEKLQQTKSTKPTSDRPLTLMVQKITIVGAACNLVSTRGEAKNVGL
jgi:hypothetical protein